MALRDITLEDIESLAVGAWVLGTGGGGSPYLGLLNMRALYKEGHQVQLMPAADLADDDWVAAVSNMGAPLVGQERLTDSRTIARAVSLMEEHIRLRFRGIHLRPKGDDRFGKTFDRFFVICGGRFGKQRDRQKKHHQPGKVAKFE